MNVVGRIEEDMPPVKYTETPTVLSNKRPPPLPRSVDLLNFN